MYVMKSIIMSLQKDSGSINLESQRSKSNGKVSRVHRISDGRIGGVS